MLATALLVLGGTKGTPLEALARASSRDWPVFATETRIQPAVMVCPACITAAIVANAPTVLAGKASSVGAVCSMLLLW